MTKRKIRTRTPNEQRADAWRENDWTALQREIRAEWDKRTLPIAIFPSREAKLAWLAEGAKSGVTPPLPEGAYYEPAGSQSRLAR